MYIGYNRIKTLIALNGLNMHRGTLPSNTTILLPTILVKNKKVSIKERFYNEFIKNYIYSYDEIIDFNDDLLKDSINYFLDKLFDLESSAPNIIQHSVTSSGSYDSIEIKIQKYGNLWIPGE